jgi:hypothetical protein
MGYGTIMEFDVDLDTHRAIMAAVGDDPVNGLIVHTAGSSAAGVRCIDVWESKDDSERFFGERLMPAMAGLDIRGGPPVSFEELDLPVILRGG